MLLSQLPLTFLHIHKGCPLSSHSFWLFSWWLGQSLWSSETSSMGGHLWTQYFCSAHEFCEWVQVGIDVYIPHWMYQVKPHWSPWFSTACDAAIFHRNHFFHLHQKQKSSDSKVKFRQVCNHCKRVFEAAEFSYYTKRKESITSQKLGSRDFWQIENSILSKAKSAIPPLFNSPRYCLLHMIKQNRLLKTFLRTLILMTQVSLYLFSLLQLIWNCIIFL